MSLPAEEFQSFAKAVAAALDWTYCEREADRRDSADIDGPDGMKLYLNNGYWDHSRITIMGSRPQSESRNHFSVNWPDNLRITVAPNRPANAVAKDIGRRLLPNYREAFQKASEEIDERHQQRMAAERIANNIAGILGCEVSKNNGPGSDFQIHPRNLRNGYADIKVSEYSNEVEINLRWISPELAERVCAALRQEVCYESANM
ncbi:MAG: hypothetical protein ABSH28_01070 [Acidobacteriota bacterium]